MDFNLPGAQEFFAGVLAIILAITVHEFAHAYAADRSGDETPRRNGRISLNPLDHLDPVGSIMILFTLLAGFGLGWGKPVPVNPMNFRRPRWDDIKVSMWGPLSNLILALAVGTLLRFGLIADPQLQLLAVRVIFINIAIALFNMIPVPPLDGSHILANLLPYHYARGYQQFMGQFGLIVIIALLATGGISLIISKPLWTLFYIFIGR